MPKWQIENCLTLRKVDLGIEWVVLTDEDWRGECVELMYLGSRKWVLWNKNLTKYKI